MTNLPRRSNIVLDHRYHLGSFRDWSKYGNHGAPTDLYFHRRGVEGVQVKFGSAGGIVVPYSPELDLSDKCTMFFYGEGNTASDLMCVISQASAGGDGFKIQLSGAAASLYQNSKSWAIVNDSATTAKTYFDGSFNVDIGNSPIVNTEDDITIGNYYDLSLPYLMPMKGVILWDVELSAEEISQAHQWVLQQFSPIYPKSNFSVISDVIGSDKEPYIMDDLSDAYESVSDEGGTVGTFLSNTECRFGDTSGRFRISRDEDSKPREKFVECTTAGVLYQPARQMYGTWEFNIYKGSGSSQPYITFVADRVGPHYVPKGYQFIIGATELFAFRRISGGSGVYLYLSDPGAAEINVWYRIRITRKQVGLWSLYIRGGVYDKWNMLFEDQTDSVYTTPFSQQYCVLDLDAGDRMGDFRFYSGVVT